MAKEKIKKLDSAYWVREQYAFHVVKAPPANNFKISIYNKSEKLGEQCMNGFIRYERM